MIQKVIKVGSSLAVTIPKSVADTKGIQQGDKVEFSITDNGLHYQPMHKTAVIDKDLMSWADKFTDKYKDALIELKNR